MNFREVETWSDIPFAQSLMRARYPTAFNDPDWRSMIYKGDYDMVGYTVRTCHPTGAFHAHEKLVAKKLPPHLLNHQKQLGTTPSASLNY